MKLKPLLALVFLSGAMLEGCGSPADTVSAVKADGWFGLDRLSQSAVDAIAQACSDPRGASETGLSYEECVLIIAGSAVRESSWDVNKGCEAWGNSWDPACGLTQSRRMDAAAVGLDCNPAEQSANGYKCNALTGLRNLRCKADGGSSCDRWGSGRTLYVGIKKHLGPNQGVFDSYKYDMQTIYGRSDVRQRLGLGPNVRGWDHVLHAWQ